MTRLTVPVLIMWFGGISYYIVLVADSFGEVALGVFVLIVGLEMIDYVLDAIDEVMEGPEPQSATYSTDIHTFDTTEMCLGCGTELDTNSGEIYAEVGKDYYCKDCATVCQAVMENYREWLDTTKDIRRKNNE